MHGTLLSAKRIREPNGLHKSTRSCKFSQNWSFFNKSLMRRVRGSEDSGCVAGGCCCCCSRACGSCCCSCASAAYLDGGALRLEVRRGRGGCSGGHCSGGSGGSGCCCCLEEGCKRKMVQKKFRYMFTQIDLRR